MKSPDQGLARGAQMIRGTVLHILHHPYQENGNGDAMKDAMKDLNLEEKEYEKPTTKDN